MVFPPDSLFEARRKLFDDVAAGRITEDAAYQRCIELDPDDFFALEWLGIARHEAGDYEAAERYFWRSAQANPGRFQSYFGLCQIPSLSDTPLGVGLMELAMRKLLLDEEGLKVFTKSFKPMKDLKRIDRRSIEQLVAALLELRTLEPQRVTDRLRPHRLIHGLQEGGEPDRELVDRIVEYGAECGPFLKGLLRAWAVDEVADSDAAVCVALLGEIGDPESLPELFECALTESDDVNGAASWAIDRIAERRPAEALAVFRRLAAEGDGETVLLVTQHLTMMPAVEGRLDLQQSLADRLSDVPKEGRDAFFLATIIGLTREGQRGRALALGLLTHHGKHVDSRIVQEARKVLASPASFELNPPELASIYEVCCGEAGPSDEDEDRDEEAAVPEPRKRPGRNEPCWCGSGKKYKHCHLRQDERPEQPPELELRDRVASFLMDSMGPSDLERAAVTYFGPYHHPGRPPADNEKLALLEWMMYDYALPRFGRTPVEEYLERNRSGLSPEECKLLESWTAGRFSLYEVQEVQRDVGLRLKDLLRGGEIFVHDVRGSRLSARWDCLLLRVLEENGRHVLSGIGTQVPLARCGEFREWVAAEQRAGGLEWPAFLRANSHRLQQKARQLAEEIARSLKVVSPEGDELTPSKAVYDVKDRDGVLTALRGCPELHRDPDEGGAILFGWTEPRPGETARRSLGSLRLERHRLILECMTRERLARGKKLLARLAGRGLKHRADEFTPLQEAMRRGRAAGPPPPSDIPPEVEREILGKFLNDHYAKWPDMSLPALGGKTPRQAVTTPAGRARVGEILKQMENGEERNRQQGRAWYDVSQLKATLGLE